MRTLNRKLMRDVGTLKSQLVAIVLIIACGVASFVSVINSYRGLKLSRDTYYARYRIADLFAPIKRAPRSIIRRLEQVEGVRQIEARIVLDVTLDMPTIEEPVSGRVISVPDKRRAILNDLHLTSGGWFEGDGTRQVIVADRFAEAHGLRPGDSILVLMNNRKEALRVVATALSPEYVYLIRGGGDIVPDPKRFTVLWMSETFAEAAFDYEDACNDVVATLDPGANEEEVIVAFDHELDRYGAIGAYGLDDQVSNRFLRDDIEGLRGSATMIPSVFLGVAAFVLNMLLGRLVRTQRTQIAVFRAFGYHRREIVAHYLGLALLVGVAGSLVGIAMGLWLARWMLGLYGQFYSFPVLDFRPDPVAVFSGVLVSVGCCLLGALNAARRAARLQPADGLRPEAPRIYGRVGLERLGFIWKRLGLVTRMILRNLARTRLRAAVTLVAVALGTSLLTLTFFMTDSMDELIDVTFRLQSRQDARVTFYDERGRAALHEMRRLPGVLTAEPELGVPVKLVNGWRERRSAITGLARGQSLRALLNHDLEHVPMPEEGLLLTAKLAELLALRRGDQVEVQVLTGEKRRFLAPVESVVEEYLGMSAYANLDQLSRWIGESTVLTGVTLSLDEEREAQVSRELKSLPAVAGVSFKKNSIQSFEETVAASQGLMNGLLTMFAGVITFGVIYNTTRISLAERKREMGSLRVMGFTDREVGGVLSGENVLLTALALPLGLAFGSWLCWLLTESFDTDLFRFPFIIRPENLIKTAGWVLLFTLLANVAVLRRIRHLDIVEVLKARE